MFILLHMIGSLAVETLISSSMDSQPPQYLHGALSLLSTDACDSSRPRSVHVPVFAQGSHLQANNITTGIVKPWTYGVPQSSPQPLGSSAPPGLWHAEEQWSGNFQRLSMNPNNAGISHNYHNGNAFQESLLSEGQQEFGFDLMHIN